MEFDFSRWPVWALLILTVANLFREQIGSFIPAALRDFFKHRAARQTDREEHQQLIEEALLDGELQDRVTEQLRESRREETLIQLIRDKDRWIEQVLTKQLGELQAGQGDIIKELRAIRRNSEQATNILATIHISLSELAKKL